MKIVQTRKNRNSCFLLPCCFSKPHISVVPASRARRPGARRVRDRVAFLSRQALRKLTSTRSSQLRVPRPEAGHGRCRPQADSSCRRAVWRCFDQRLTWSDTSTPSIRDRLVAAVCELHSVPVRRFSIDRRVVKVPCCSNLRL